jgi:sugar lactone lactonase YvrE
MTALRHRLVIALAAALVALTTAAPQVAAETPRPRWDTRVFAKVGSPGYPANVYVHPNGRVYAGTYSNLLGDKLRSKVFEWSANGTLLRTWTVPGQHLDKPHGVQVSISDSQGRLVLLEKSTSRVLRLNLSTGKFSTYATLPDLPTCSAAAAGVACSPNLTDHEAIPNYSVWGPKGELYVTDFAQAVIWRVPPGGGTPRPWFTDRRLDGVEFGTAGIALSPQRNALYVMQQTSLGLGELSIASGKLYKLPITSGGRPGTLTKVWTSRLAELPDGFGIAKSGRIYIGNAGLMQQIVVIDSLGKEIERFPKTPLLGDNGSAIPFDGPSNATFFGNRLLVANQAPLGNTSHHAILDVNVGEPGVKIYIPAGAGS